MQSIFGCSKSSLTAEIDWKKVKSEESSRRKSEKIEIPQQIRVKDSDAKGEELTRFLLGVRESSDLSDQEGSGSDIVVIC